MTCNITNTPLHPEPLPLYRRDPETASIISSAPSYHSDAPTYSSRRQSFAQAPPSSLLNLGTPSPRNVSGRSGEGLSTSAGGGLPAPRYAPGFQSRAHGSIRDVESHNYNVSNWSSINSSHASKQYHAVASRRVNAANKATSVPPMVSSLLSPVACSSTISHPGLGGNSSSVNLTASVSSANTLSSTAPTIEPDEQDQPLNPHEDPALVGETAAARAKASRLYRETCLRGDRATMWQENHTWDFMLTQMTEWEQREESWRKFQAKVNAGQVRFGFGIGGGSKLLARGRRGRW